MHMWCCHLSGVVVPVHLQSYNSVDEEQLAKILTDVMTAAKSCKSTVSPLVHQYNKSSVQHQRSQLKRLIRNEHHRELRGFCPTRMLSHCVKLVTDCSLSDITPNHAVAARHIIIVYWLIMTVDALLELQRMIYSGHLSRLFSDIYTAFVNTGLISILTGGIFSPFTSTTVSVILSTEEYQIAYSLLTFTGKLSLIIVCCEVTVTEKSGATFLKVLRKVLGRFLS